VRTTRELDRVDRTTIECIPTTSPVRTLIDIAAVMPFAEYEDTLDLALVTGVVRMRPLEARARALWTPARPGCATVLHLLESRSVDVMRTRNKWEARVLRQLETAGAAPPRVNFRLRSGGQNRQIDLAWPDLKVAVEFDGFVPHSSRRVFDDDRARQNALVAEGWRVFRLTKTALERDTRTAFAPILAAVAP
jgi:very-short-patch-repair endonuclease